MYDRELSASLCQCESGELASNSCSQTGISVTDFQMTRVIQRSMSLVPRCEDVLDPRGGETTRERTLSRRIIEVSRRTGEQPKIQGGKNPIEVRTHLLSCRKCGCRLMYQCKCLEDWCSGKVLAKCIDHHLTITHLIDIFQRLRVDGSTKDLSVVRLVADHT
jgi:hypothetical protein